MHLKTQIHQAWLLISFAGLAIASSAHAEVKPNGLFVNGAVLQQGMEVPVWGTAKDGEKVTVKFQNQQVSTTAKDGHWLVKLKPLKPGGPYSMTITGDNKIEITDLLVGEVWICSGQSNMAMQLIGTTNAKAVVAAAGDSQLRLGTIKTARGEQGPLEDVSVSWHESGPYANSYSAVAYFFGRDLRKALKVPVGLIHGSVGATAICWWMNQQAFEIVPALRPVLEGECKNNTSVLYNGMIAPLQPYAIRGVIWYQGESDSPHPDLYQRLLPAMIAGWRKAWGQGEFPFLFVQAATNDQWPPEIREAQLISWQKTPKTAMAVATDCGDPVEIHPPNKEPVGARLALAARAVAYGEKIEYSGPIYESMKVAGDRLVLSFQHIGTGLVAKDGELRGFTITGTDGKFVKANAKIVGATVVVSSPNVLHPTAARFAWTNSPNVNFYNQEGLPASPFRTDKPGK